MITGCSGSVVYTSASMATDSLLYPYLFLAAGRRQLLDVVNNGDGEQLQQLWGIGPKRAAAIARERERAPFK
jgi:DNA uptake protein ComE-like DNA-binding protein